MEFLLLRTIMLGKHRVPRRTLITVNNLPFAPGLITNLNEGDVNAPAELKSVNNDTSAGVISVTEQGVTITQSLFDSLPVRVVGPQIQK